MMVEISGKWYYTEADVEASGYLPLPESVNPVMLSYCAMDRLHEKYNLAHGGIVCLRFTYPGAVEGWRVFRKPDAVAGYQSQPMLPGTRY